ncbi:MAG: S8 family serine peptidase [Ignavibacteria bacterium]|jgi:subtilisin family serine protease
MRLYRIVILALFIGASNFAGSNYIEKDGVKYFADRIVVKFKNTVNVNSLSKAGLTESTQKVFDSFGLSSISSRFHITKNSTPEEIELSKIKLIENQSSYDPLFIAKKLEAQSEIEWAEPYYIDEIDYVPNDFRTEDQYNLLLIKAQEAWEISKGATNVVIAIVDTGVDWDHPDLAGNIWTNSGEIAGNNYDDDENGYKDDVRGWDFGGLNGTSDNNPTEDRPDHGTFVAGIASAVTDNGVGIASIGFNCKIMAVKTSRDDVRDDNDLALISYGYDGIKYAADNGANVINCSWGGSAYSQANQEVIDYAISKGALVVAAAGNDNEAEVNYPARYSGVLSVGSSDSHDVKSGFSNYGIGLDVVAPGSEVLSTWQEEDGYIFGSGTSFSSPLAAGLAGLVFSVFPEYSPLQVAEQIRINADNIDENNSGLEYNLGSGRINALKALSNSDSKSLRADEITFNDEGNGDGILEPGENVSIEISFTNYLASLSALTITIETSSPSITLLNNTFNKGAVGTGDTFDNSSNKFVFTIGEDAEENLEAEFLLRYSDGDYDDFQLTSVFVNPTYKTHNNDMISLTVTSKGTLGFNDYPNNLEGDGFSYSEWENLLYEGALMYSISANQLSDAARDETGDSQSDDFTRVTPFDISEPGDLADQQGYTVFNDDNAGSNKFGIETELYTFCYDDSPNNEYIILKYLLKNNSSSNYNNFYAGLYFDWDVGTDDVTKVSSTDNFAYQYNYEGSGPYIGVALLSQGNLGYYAIHNNGGDGGFGVYDGFTKAEKWQALSNGVSKDEAGPYDVSYVISAGPFSLSSNDTLEFAVAIVGGETYESLSDNIEASKEKYDGLVVTGIEDDESEDELPSEYSLNQNYPNPFNPVTTIKYQIPKDDANTASSSKVLLKVYGILGNEIATLVNEEKSPGEYSVEFDASNLPSGIYLYTLRSGSFVSTKKMVLIK